MSPRRYMHLNLVANDINLHQGAYKYEQAHGIPERNTFERLLEYGRFGDEGLFTALFIGDIPGLNGSPAFDGGPAEPITALTAISQHTRHVGLIATASTTFYDPYNLARLLASLDQASDGRAGYNAVTSVIDQFAQNYSLEEHLDREARYRRADEFLDVLRALWDNRTVRRDPDGLTRFYAEPINHRGNRFQVAGALNIAPSRQGRPLIAQAGGSGPGIKVAAKHAEMVFTNSSTREGAAAYRESLDKALVEQGRAPGSVPPIPGLIPYLGRTAKEAEEKLHELDSHVNWEPIAPFALGQFGIEVPFEDIDDAFPTELLPRPEDVEKTIKSTFGNYVGLYNWIQERPEVTVREVVAQAVGRGGATHRKFVGSYDDLVEDFAAWHADGNVGGFNLMFSAGAQAIREFIDEVVPRLIERGIYRSTPHDRPLRERF
ncbi:NtaA/DmoA family FMN-dependent monooxygenase [Mycolicibacterium diernhoferi]|uniref:FMNH2-dependent monooxygenase n=1 Tax=Mycolicibacterium diernhoferi TaxID=1801 RepID=A0A1Q4HAK8_9MYCO|nr:NtaA/DmoA family FMN-dependent monooxygenase [Mycolicibacterium diernhoferi]OJZ64472.1 FMNH2-dependent monooxygenase [Mycolicibacterium diernhoferi]OPE53394.1 FMNH2-dependent monooxygenase [Mycolicibacterium diernhoferi]PEG52305.1 FMNH2-dependent monooxygenase [Mycolicibacterium diernhoferi]QYL24297.1 NtaA/DmoA family FMN-dependent monooxygenase [Mycolicibacterium diernhoferi]